MFGHCNFIIKVFMFKTGLFMTVSRKSLLFIASFVWFLAGGFLIYRGVSGILNEAFPSLIKSLVAIILGMVFYLGIFNRVSKKHIERIKKMPSDTVPFYSFFNRRSFLMMMLMMSMGIALKVLGILPSSIMVYFFPVMGLPLLISSMRFFKNAVSFN